MAPCKVDTEWPSLPDAPPRHNPPHAPFGGQILRRGSYLGGQGRAFGGLLGEKDKETRVTGERTLAAAGMIVIYASIIGFTDNFVRVIAAEAGLWQFHATRTAMAMGILLLALRPLGLRLKAYDLRAVVARSAIHGFAMVIYFGALAFLPVALVAAGLFTAPIFVLLIEYFAYGTPMGLVRILAVALGFGGVILVLGPEAMQGASLPALLPIAAGALYAMGNIATIKLAVMSRVPSLHLPLEY
ncbi:MAG: hypothetical protein WCO04_14950, partial [Pseudomonadota bacterium]